MKAEISSAADPTPNAPAAQASVAESPFAEPIAEPIVRALRAAVVLLCHVALAGVIYTTIVAFEAFVHFLEGGHEVLVFDRFPLRYMFQAIDVAVIMAFGLQGAKEAYKAFGGHR